MCITRLLFFFFKSHPVRNIEQPVRIPPDGPGSVVPPSSVPRPGQPAHSPGDAAGRTRRTEDRRVGQVRPLGRKSRHTHTHTHAVRWGKVRSQFAEVYPKLLLFLGGVPLSRQERALGRENAFRCVSLRDLPSVLLTGGGMVEEGWCVGIKMAGGEVFVRAETPPPCLWNPNNGERRGSGVWRGAHGAQRGARVPVAPTTKRFLYDFIRSSIFEGTWHETYF